MIITRFAPSPTGVLHLGSLRTALYNWLLAKSGPPGSQFYVRIEDTDQSREVAGARERLLTDLRWAGVISTDPCSGQELRPVIQSERVAVYRDHAQLLVDGGWAYRCFCSPHRLNQVRRLAAARGGPQVYDRRCLGLSRRQTEDKMRHGEPHVVRLRVPRPDDSCVEPGEGPRCPSAPPSASPSGAATAIENDQCDADTVVTIDDAVRGPVTFDCRFLDDPVLLKSDGFPTYHLANVVDDRLMGVTHVVRGEEWLPSTPKHSLLYRAFGWGEPVFAHLPLLLNSDRSKFSKRSSASATVDQVRQDGVEPLALLNFVARLGCSFADVREPPSTGAARPNVDRAGDNDRVAPMILSSESDDRLWSLDDLAARFSLERVHKSGAVVDPRKMYWFNRQLLQQTPLPLLRRQLRQRLDSDALRGAVLAAADEPRTADAVDRAVDCWVDQLIQVFRDHMTTLPGLVNDAQFLFKAPGPSQWDAATASATASDAQAAKLERTVVSALGRFLENEIFLRAEDAGTPGDTTNGASSSCFTPDCVQKALATHAPSGAAKRAVRLAATGRTSGPPLAATLALLGRSQTKERCQAALAYFQSKNH